MHSKQRIERERGGKYTGFSVLDRREPAAADPRRRPDDYSRPDANISPPDRGLPPPIDPRRREASDGYSKPGDRGSDPESSRLSWRATQLDGRSDERPPRQSSYPDDSREAPRLSWRGNGNADPRIRRSPPPRQSDINDVLPLTPRSAHPIENRVRDEESSNLSWRKNDQTGPAPINWKAAKSILETLESVSRLQQNGANSLPAPSVHRDEPIRNRLGDSATTRDHDRRATDMETEERRLSWRASTGSSYENVPPRPDNRLDPRVSGSRAADPRVAASRIPDPSISDRRDPRIPEPRSSDPRASDPRANSGGHTNGLSWRGNADAPRPRPSIPADGPGRRYDDDLNASGLSWREKHNGIRNRYDTPRPQSNHPMDKPDPRYQQYPNSAEMSRRAKETDRPFVDPEPVMLSWRSRETNFRPDDRNLSWRPNNQGPGPMPLFSNKRPDGPPPGKTRYSEMYLNDGAAPPPGGKFRKTYR